MNPDSAPSPGSLPLAQLLGHTADAVGAVRAGTSLTAALERCAPAARAGTQSLSFEVLRWLGSATAVRAQLARRAPAPKVDALLLTALALLWPQGECPYAAHTLVDQAVDCARQRAPQAASFVNAVLRRYLRERDALVATALNDPVGRYNHPVWWIERLRQDWPAQWEAVLRADNQRAPMTLRVNARRTTAAAYVQRLADHGIGASALGEHTVVLREPCPVARLPGFAEGDVSVQDGAAQRAAGLLLGAGLRPGARVLDACSAPGGKTAQLLERAALEVWALDRDGARLQRVVQTLQRLGLHAHTRVADALRPQDWWDGQPFEAILLDAPCSAAGIVRRHPDVRWLRRASDIDALAQTQAALLDALWPTLAGGGRLLYCTCSVFKAEGQDQIEAFLQRQGDARVALSPASPGHLLPLPDNADDALTGQKGSVADGFFYCLIEKS